MVKLLKVKGYDVKTPMAGKHPVDDPEVDFSENAGIDFYVPNYNVQFEADFRKYNPGMTIDEDNDGKVIRIPAGKNVIVPAGWYTKFPDNMMFLVCNKSGVANKQHLSYAAHVIDSSYQGNLLMSVFNYGSDWTSIHLGEKLVQLVQVPILSGAEIVPEDTNPGDFFEKKSERGAGALGSTGLK